MLSAEQIFDNSQPLRTLPEIRRNHPLAAQWWGISHVIGGTIPYWESSAQLQPELLYIRNLQIMDPTRVVCALDVPQVAKEIFTTNSGSTVLDETVQILTKGRKRINDIVPGSLQALSLQKGAFAEILLYQAQLLNHKPVQWVVYLSRDYSGSTAGDEAERNYHQLLHLGEKIDSHLSDPQKGKYNVVRPIALGNLSRHHRTYPYFTMHFARGVAEIGMDKHPGAPFPFFAHAMSFNKEMESTFINAMDGAKTRAFQIVAGEFLSEGLQPYNADRKECITHSLELIFQRDAREIIRASALVFLLLDRYFPSEFQINAGDWMGKFNKQDNSITRLVLATTRGPLIPMTENEWINFIKTFTDIDPVGEAFTPFGQLPIEIIAEELQNAQRILQDGGKGKGRRKRRKNTK